MIYVFEGRMGSGMTLVSTALAYTIHREVLDLEMKYYAAKPKLKKEERQELEDKLTSLDKAMLVKAEKGCRVTGIIRCGKPFINKYGVKEFASTSLIMKALEKLTRVGLLERR